MPIGPGKYDDWVTKVREGTEARGAIVIILNGKHGNGFGVQALEDITPDLPGILRFVADQIESSLKQYEAQNTTECSDGGDSIPHTSTHTNRAEPPTEDTVQ